MARSRLLSFRPLVIGGEISYSIYMTHQVVNLGILPHIRGLSLSLTFLLVTTITLTSSAFLFYFLEAPVRDAVKARLKTKTPAIPPLSAIISRAQLEHAP